MKSTILTGILLLTIFSAGAQGLKEIILPFNYLQCTSFEYDVQDKIDYAYKLLNQGEKARLVLYTEQERLNKSHAELQSLTEKRAKLVNAYLAARNSMAYSEIKNVIPFLENDINNSTEANDRFSDAIHRPLPGLHSVLLNKTEANTKYYTHIDTDAETRNCQEFEIYTKEENVFYTAGGVTIRVHADSFVYENGGTHPCGTVTMCVSEFLTYGDMLSADLVTHSNGKMLETGGMVYIEVNCENKKLKLANNKTIQIIFPADEKKEGMQAFNGSKSKNISHWLLQKGGDVSFTKADTYEEMIEKQEKTEEKEIEYDDEGNELDYYSERGESVLDNVYYNMTDGYLLTSANLGWINCDRFTEIEQKTELLVSSHRKETICYRLVFRDIRSIMPAYEYDAKGNYLFENVPSGQQATLLAFYLSKDKKNALFGYKEITLGKTKEEKVELQEISGDALKNMFAEVFPQ